jgi:hypothetical protein
MNVLNSMLLTTNTWLKKTSRVTFVIIITSTSYLIIFLFNLLFGLIKEKDIVWHAFPDDMDPFILFFTAVWLAPILETWICQYLPYYFLNKVKYLRERNYLILILSALFFGAGHFYSLFYIIFGFLAGIILMYGYMVRVKTDKNIFCLIAITHALVNLGGFIVTVVLKS